MSQIIATIVITQDDEGRVNLQGTGERLYEKAYAYGLLELAKDILRDQQKPRVQVATMNDLPH